MPHHLMLTIGDRAFTWIAPDSASSRGVLSSLDRDGQRMLASLRAGLPAAGETREDVIAAAVTLGKKRGEPVSIIGSDAKAVR